MLIYKELMTDEAIAPIKKKILRKLWMNVGQIDIYLVCLNEGPDQFDIIHAGILKQKRYPKKDLRVLGIAKGWESAAYLSGRLYEHFREKYKEDIFKTQIEADKSEMFRRL
ncbi:MAG: hypothetical protein IK078_06460 [Lachnospiraceae bacterium]|nr:hypothetical protein [Lachnospiraceae bacterium]